MGIHRMSGRFLSIQAQDFIEEDYNNLVDEYNGIAFLSIQAQDFIEEWRQ